jgi:hypothetical protein
MGNKCFLSVDFEDFSHDFKRQLGINIDGPINETALVNSYNKIEEFCQEYLNGAKLTFFCTGIVAKKFPEIIKKISDDGHEIACHYYYHDKVYNDNIQLFEENLIKSIYYLEKASNQKVYGFRAPMFTLNTNCTEYFKILEKYFIYDSSLNLSTIKEIDNFRRKSSIYKLQIYPVSSIRPFKIFPKMKTGGTYLKLQTPNLAIQNLITIKKNGITPLVYLHPYEFVDDKSFMISYSELSTLSFFKKIYWLFRQHQWHSIGNRYIPNKIFKIFSHFECGGKMCNLNN